MNTKTTLDQDIYPAILALWSILATTGILLIDSQISPLALALLAMIVIFTTTRLFAYSGILSMLAATVIYLASYFAIFPFSSLAALFTPVSVVVIFIATEGLGALLMRQMRRKNVRVAKDLQLLTDLIQYDAETGLMMWKHANQKLDAELARCRRYQKTFSLVLLEPSDSTYEHLSSGDRKELNLSIARLLLQTCRVEVDIPFTGRHFGVILPETDTNGAIVFARRLLSASAKRALLDLRIATASFPGDGVTSEELLANCEAALKTAIDTAQSIVHAEVRHTSEEVDVVSPLTAPVPVEAPNKSLADHFDELGPDEYLLTFSEFHNMADIPLVQENLTNFKEIEEATLLEFTEGKLVFKLKSKVDLSDKQFTDQLRNRLKSNWLIRNQRTGK